MPDNEHDQIQLDDDDDAILAAVWEENAQEESGTNAAISAAIIAAQHEANESGDPDANADEIDALSELLDDDDVEEPTELDEETDDEPS